MPFLRTPFNLDSPQSRFLLVVLVFTTSRLLNLALFVATDAHVGTEYPDLERRIQLYGHKWDSGYYWHIATQGYRANDGEIASGRTRHAFYPLLPLLTRGLSSATGLDISISGIILSNACFLGALWFFVAYCRTRTDDATTARALLLIAFVPQNFIFSAFYTESLFLLLTLAAWVSFDQRHTARACFFAALLTATRTNGLFIIVYFAFETLKELQGLRTRNLNWSEMGRAMTPFVLPIVFTPLGLFAFWWFCFITTGDAFAQKSAAFHGWSAYLVIPFHPLLVGFLGDPKNTFWLSAGLFFLISSLLLPKYRLYGDFLFVLANLLLFFSNHLPHSMLRYCMVLFPIYLGLSMLTRRRPLAFIALLALFISINAFLCYAWVTKQHIAI
ncbi:MAG: mannosyltransferase family protein [Opitutaceae bacterium]